MDDRYSGLFNRIAHGLESLRRGYHVELVLGHLDIVGAGLKREFEQAVFIGGAFFDRDNSALFEQPADASGLTKIAAVAGEQEAQFGDEPIAIVGQGVERDRDAARAVTFIDDLFELAAAERAG